MTGLETTASAPETFAVVRTGGKQYRVSAGSKISVEFLAAEIGTKIVLDDVLLVHGAEGSTKVGTPRVEGASVQAKVIGQGRATKVVIFKKIRRKGHTKKQGHRQSVTTLEIEAINA